MVAVVGNSLLLHDSPVAVLDEPALSLASGLLVLAGTTVFALAWMRNGNATGSGTDANA